ncbi:4-hydroxy-tetrahydrodipicolinate synthase [Psychrobium sp. 1_MG-2023]|uniref:4-hydroxy-tetrahydrodipicolinate synthase n=1 Tax=Psychrobium sp. 1_MG-2023 TaxID=3062624 RepID=UPI000C31B976|nr:4-hydroxy-tetrahydrodipicolinate synthase [Psychrobium sp. 1_MG-2023]MDP2561843.1 4-hydroxy-tetrahydrodipicolinate synthase [Psychrobium sp. 1_MG-2023]PKF55786.1 4-hydroxy-tetrahydrodipicolinate synthase [Alteromonadales bacterium alter-6D02]
MSSFNVKDYPLWTALVTPFNERGRVDYDALATLLDQQAAAGNGILMLGSTGEGLALSLNEQKKIIRFVCQHQPQAPIMVAVGGYNLESQLEWLEFCNQLPIDAYLLAAPLYAKPGPKGQEQWFRSLLERSKFPCMLYNVPSRSGVELSPQALANLTDEAMFWSVKEASGSVVKFNEFKQALPGVAIYSGDDALLPEFSLLGASGLVSVCANAWPQPTNLYVQQCLDTPHRMEFNLWKAAIEPLFSVANPIPVKVLLHHTQQIGHPQLRLPLTHSELTEFAPLMAANESINQWFTNQQ